MFDKNGSGYCHKCLEKNKKEYELISDFLKRSPDATVLEVVLQTGVPFKSIKVLVEEGSFTFVDGKKMDESN
jgi:hypothetical protein